MTLKSTLIISLVGALCLWQTSLADKPSPPPADAGEQIRQALQGDHASGPSQDGVLDEVLDLIRRRGSVLDGSVLDGSGGDADAPDGHPPDRSSGLPLPSRRALVAEQLLKSSRLLESLGQPDRGRAQLIERMRGEAVTLLND